MKAPYRSFGALMVTAALAGCGGGSTGSPHTATTATGSPNFAKAERVCEAMLRETRQVGRKFIPATERRGGSNILALETEFLVKPGLRVLNHAAGRLRAIDAETKNSTFQVYVGLFEPIIQLGELRLQAGRTDNLAEANNLVQQMEDLGEEQRSVAQQAGLKTCSIDFLHALTTSWTQK